MSTSLGYNINRNPIAQSFFVDEPSGCYVTKIDLYFKTKGTAAPVVLQLRPMVNGFPSVSEIVPSSNVYVNTANINVSADATSATTFEFEEPVYLKGLVDYAMVITTTDADYEIFIAQIDEYIVGTTSARVNRNPALGSLFYSHNGGTFSAAQHQDLTFVIHRANFTATSGTISLKNAPLPLKLLDDNAISTTAGSTEVRIRDEGHGFIVNDPLTISGMDVTTSIGGLLGSNIMGTRSITKVDWTGYTFNAAASADSDDIGGGLAVKVSKNIPYSNMFLNQQAILPEETTMDTGFKGTSGRSFAGTELAYEKVGSFELIETNDTISADKPFVVANTGIETSELGAGVKSFEADVTVQTVNTFVAPMLDLQRSSVTLIDYQIDKQSAGATTGFNVPIDYVAETNPNSGSSASKHITSVIQLVEPAVGLKIILAANKKPGSDFEVYYRVSEADADISLVTWTLLTETSNNPADLNSSVYREYEYLAGGSGGTLPEFVNFQIKIVPRTDNKAYVPTIKDFRAIALSV
jgi:hypothetical protein